MFCFLFHLFCFNDFDMLVGVKLDGLGVEIRCEYIELIMIKINFKVMRFLIKNIRQMIF